MLTRPKVAIVYLSFHCEPYIGDVVSALKKITYPKEAVELVIVDNSHPTYGSSARFLEENIMPLSGSELPRITLLPQAVNLGFAGGNNVGIKWALEHDFDYIYLHNNDGFAAANFLTPLVDAMEADKTIGAVQSLLLLHPETDLINTSGNSFHYLGIGFCNNLRAKKDSVPLPKISETAYASGAAMLMRADLLRRFGVWDEDFFLYHEDIEYSFRLRLAGYKIAVAADSIFYHKYAFSRNKEKFYFIERNRLGVMLMFFRWPTLFLFFPMAIILEIGLLFFAWRNGWLAEKIKVYKYWLHSGHVRLWLGKRKNIQALRKIKDADLIKYFTGKIIFEETSVNSPLLIYVGNPLMNWYWQMVKKMIIW